MIKMFMLSILLVNAGFAAAQELGNQAPDKVPEIYPTNIPLPVRQGGDTIANATVIPWVPYYDSGTTVGFNDDHSSACYLAGGAPDVVYSIVVPDGMDAIHVSLCGSTYDTGLQILDSALVEVACNDDFCGLQSEIEVVPVIPGQTYYIVVDGYDAASGSYVFGLELPSQPCTLVLPDFCPAEGEPPLVPNYVDNHNGGCSSPNPGFQTSLYCALTEGPVHVFCGVSGWYLSDGGSYRDTDWYILHKNPGQTMEVTADAEYATYIFELYPRDCPTVAVAQQATAGPCEEAFMAINNAAADGSVWFWVGPTVFTSPDGTAMYDYVLWITGLLSECVATERSTWSNVKALYR